MMDWVKNIGLSGALLAVIPLVGLYLGWKYTVAKNIIESYHEYIRNLKFKMRGTDYKDREVKYSADDAILHILKRYDYKYMHVKALRLPLNEFDKKHLTRSVVYHGTVMAGRNPTMRLYQKYGVTDHDMRILDDANWHPSNPKIYPRHDDWIVDSTFHGYREFIDPLLNLYHKANNSGYIVRKLFLNSISVKSKRLIFLYVAGKDEII